MAQFLVVNLTSVYETADHTYPYKVAISTKALAEAGFTEVKGLADRIKNSSPSTRLANVTEGGDEQLPIPGCGQEGEFVEEIVDAPPGEETEPGNFGLRWKLISDIYVEFTANNWCIQVDAYHDE